MAKILSDSLVRRKRETNLQCRSPCRTTDLVHSYMSQSGKTEKAGAVLERENQEPCQPSEWASLGWILDLGDPARWTLLGQLGTLDKGIYST